MDGNERCGSIASYAMLALARVHVCGVTSIMTIRWELSAGAVIGA